MNQRLERKFFVRPAEIPFACLLLRQACFRDPTYPDETIHSLYFDDADMTSASASDEGYLERAKIRIRWYGSDDHPKASATVYIEEKSKKGFSGYKRRRAISVSPRQLDPAGLQDSIFGPAPFLRQLRQLQIDPPRPLVPIVLVSYRRRRFIDASAGSALSLDTEIRSRLIARNLGQSEGVLTLAGGVIELKSADLSLSPALLSLRVLNIDWIRYSKYVMCLKAHETDPGSHGQIWPPGLVPFS